MKKTFLEIFKNKKNIFYFFLFFILFFLFFRIIPDFSIYIEFFKLENFPLKDFFSYFFDKVFLSFSVQVFSDNLINIFVPFLVSLNLVLFINLYKKQKKFLEKKSFFTSFFGIFFGFFGAGCAACTGLFLAPLISFFGLSFLLDFFPYRGKEIAFLGIFILIFSCYFVLKKISNPNICK